MRLHARPSTSAVRFPKAARLLKTDEFSSVFNLRPYRRSVHFVLYMRARPLPENAAGDTIPAVLPARLGVVVGKRHAPNAVTRNLVKRAAREAFRLRGNQLAGWDFVIRLQCRFAKEDFSAASSQALKQLCRGELAQLLDAAVVKSKAEAAREPQSTAGTAANRRSAVDESSGGTEGDS